MVPHQHTMGEPAGNLAMEGMSVLTRIATNDPLISGSDVLCTAVGAAAFVLQRMAALSAAVVIVGTGKEEP